VQTTISSVQKNLESIKTHLPVSEKTRQGKGELSFLSSEPYKKNDDWLILEIYIPKESNCLVGENKLPIKNHAVNSIG